ncbi:MAG: hypothetical protein HOI41_05110, partial [Acidimicrobiaceae bacterium]|nr:hypothetical protein [Acidimicrobiaceae bacterium]
LHEAQPPSILGLIGRIAGHLWDTTQAPTAAQRAMFSAATERFDAYTHDFAQIDLDYYLGAE